ncbi:DUF3606 domain-containing protein [Pseudomonas putida]|uniref:DUF3606 domain-containing protein n=1 Tax=Pseudomonas putida TaxID=303 RepID=UPI003D972B89
MKPRKFICGTDEIRININDISELTYWADKFGVSKGEIISAVREVGDSLTAVQKQLKKILHV